MALDLTGEKYGRWTVIEEVEKIGSNRRWLCECSCPNHTRKIVYQGSLRTGKSTSCGCYSKEITAKINKKNLIGKTFGKLTVIKETEKRGPSGSVIYLCKCLCSKEVEVNTNALTTGNTKSCGCYNIERIKEHFTKIIKKDTIFGKLKVKEKTEERSSSGSIIYLCECSCKNHTLIKVRSDKLRDGSTWHCGCEEVKSKGENKIYKLLIENGIKFEKEKRFPDCKDIKTLPFDFYVNDEYVIEFDGLQHSQFTGWTDVEKVQIHDNIKNNFCKKNNIPLIRIPYTHLNDLCLDDLLLDTSKFII